MKSFKNWFTAGALALMLIAAMIIQSAKPSRTVDFRGTVLNVITSESGITTVHAEAVTGGFYLFRIDSDTKLERGDGEPIEREDVTEGSLVDVYYRKQLFKEEKVYTAKKLVLYPK